MSEYTACGAAMDRKIEAEVGRERPSGSWLPISRTRSHVSHWVTRAEARFSENFAKILEEWQLIPSEWAVLRELYRPGRRGTVELGKALGMSKGGMSKLISRLANKGYVRKEKSKFDRRFRPIGLTAYGKDAVPILAATEKDVDREFFGPLGNGRRFRLAQWLQQTLGAPRKNHMDQWLLNQLGKRLVTQPHLDQGMSEERQRAEADAFWNECKQIAEAAAWRDAGQSSGPVELFALLR